MNLNRLALIKIHMVSTFDSMNITSRKNKQNNFLNFSKNYYLVDLKSFEIVIFTSMATN